MCVKCKRRSLRHSQMCWSSCSHYLPFKRHTPFLTLKISRKFLFKVLLALLLFLFSLTYANSIHVQESLNQYRTLPHLIPTGTVFMPSGPLSIREIRGAQFSNSLLDVIIPSAVKINLGCQINSLSTIISLLPAALPSLSRGT
jgi:hypothetical protein